MDGDDDLGASEDLAFDIVSKTFMEMMLRGIASCRHNYKAEPLSCPFYKDDDIIA